MVRTEIASRAVITRREQLDAAYEKTTLRAKLQEQVRQLAKRALAGDACRWGAGRIAKGQDYGQGASLPQDFEIIRDSAARIES